MIVVTEDLQVSRRPDGWVAIEDADSGTVHVREEQVPELRAALDALTRESANR